MKIACINNTSNKGNTFVAQDISTDSLSYKANFNNTPKYLTPDYFLPASKSESYYSRKYATNTINHHHANTTSRDYVTDATTSIKPIYLSKRGKISRVASVMLLSLSFLATAVEVKAQPNLEFQAVTSIPTQQPRKKSLISRAAHKAAKRLGFSSGKPNSNTSTNPYTQTEESQHHKQPEITMEELKELYAREYGESMDATIRVGGTSRIDGLAETLKRTLALREKTLERRRAEDIFSKEPIYSKPLDAISIARSSTEYSEPWSDPDIEISEALKDEFSTSKKQQRFEPSAPPLSRYSSFSSEDRIDTRDIKLRQEELAAIELIDQAIEDSGYSSASIANSSNSASISSSPTNEVGFQGGYETDISNYSSFDTSSTEYDTEAEIRAYENAEVESQNKKLKTRKARNARAAEARYRYRDIEQGLGELHSDTDFSDGSSDEDSASATDGYDTVYTSSSSEYSNDETSEWDTDFSDDNSNKDDVPLPPPPTAEELAALGALVELDNRVEPAELDITYRSIKS